MSSTQEGTTLILASIAVCLMIYAMNQQYNGSSKTTLISSAHLGGTFQNAKKKFLKWKNGGKNKSLGAKRARVKKGLDCNTVGPSDPNWARCAQGAGVGRVPTRNAKTTVFNSPLEFEKDNNKHQGLGSRLQDGFVNDQFSSDNETNLGGKGPKGMRIDRSNLKNNAFFSQGTENASSMMSSGISSEGGGAFPFARKSTGPAEPEEPKKTTRKEPVPGTEAVGMGMSMKEFARGPRPTPMSEEKGRPMGKRETIDRKGRGARGQEFVAKTDDESLGSAFNPFVDTPSKSLGAGLKLNEAFNGQTLGSGSRLEDAFAKGSLGSAVSPVSSNVGVSTEEISSATAVLDNINIVQSTTGGQLNFGIRP